MGHNTSYCYGTPSYLTSTIFRNNNNHHLRLPRQSSLLRQQHYKRHHHHHHHCCSILKFLTWTIISLSIPCCHYFHTTATAFPVVPQQQQQQQQLTHHHHHNILFQTLTTTSSSSRRHEERHNKRTTRIRKNTFLQSNSNNNNNNNIEPSSNHKSPIIIIGGGLSGLTAALTTTTTSRPIHILESSTSLGGRVKTTSSSLDDDDDDDGFSYDIGFAVFIERYPRARQLFNYTALELRPFLPGALVRSSNKETWHRLVDPLRRPRDALAALTSGVGTIRDKFRLIKLIRHVFISSVDDLFSEDETSTLECLRRRYKLSPKIIDEFFRPFLEGIYLCPLEEQSSRMFHFVFKMFGEGNVSLPRDGMGAIVKQLEERLVGDDTDVSWECDATVVGLSPLPSPNNDDDDARYVVTLSSGRTLTANSIVIATDGPNAQRLISTLEGYHYVSSPFYSQPQRRVGCLYYAFRTPLPVSDPLLLLDGSRGEEGGPINNACFPTAVSEGYAPPGWQLCSVTILSDVLDRYRNDTQTLDRDARRQLCRWFPSHSNDIMTRWELKRSFIVEKAQPGQLNGIRPANVHGGRGCRSLGDDVVLPEGVYVCGDHVATATLNGAIESGVLVGEALMSEGMNE